MSIFFSKERDGTLNVRVTGYVTKAPKVTEKIILFSVCYGRKKYIDCKAWKRHLPGELASLLERHDYVSVEGVFETYTGSDGTARDQIVVDGIFPMSFPSVAAEASPTDLPPSTTTYQQLSSEMDDYGGDLPF